MWVLVLSAVRSRGIAGLVACSQSLALLLSWYGSMLHCCGKARKGPKDKYPTNNNLAM